MTLRLVACIGEETYNKHHCDTKPKINSPGTWSVYVEGSRVSLDKDYLASHEKRIYVAGFEWCWLHIPTVNATTNSVFVENQKVNRHKDPVPGCNYPEDDSNNAYVNVTTLNSTVWAG